MAIYLYTANEEEVRQAKNEAEEAHGIDVVGAPDVDPRSEELQVRHHFVGFLGEIVICRVNGWKRNRHTRPDLFDAEDSEGRKIEVKTRTKWSRDEIPVKPGCDLAMLLHYFVDEKRQHCFQVVKSYERHYLESHKWNIFITQEFWEACLKDMLIRNLGKVK